MPPSSPCPDLDGVTALVVGGTGKVGFFAVDGLLRAGADVLVPVRDAVKFDRLRSRLAPCMLGRLVGIPGDLGTPEGVEAVVEQAEARTFGGLDAVVSALATWHQGMPVLTGGFETFRSVVEATLYPHFLVAEFLVPSLKCGGSYTTISGSAGFANAVRARSGALAATTAARNRLTLAIADQTEGDPRVNDVVMWAYPDADGSCPGSSLKGREIGDFLAWLASREADGVHGRTIHLRTPGQVCRALNGVSRPEDLAQRGLIGAGGPAD
ncbi:SDR family oxidoreductase [Streptomyces sp. NPDC048278]|uniref:SDR family oxidoreductase n=1 Tax=unclassified Streptomyces TaxID=2593676 RepID=UPI003413A636